MPSVSEQSQTQRGQRRRFSVPFKFDLVMQCRLGNASVAAIAQAHDIHANMLRRWVREQALRDQQQATLATAGTPNAAPSTAPLTTAMTGASAQTPVNTSRFIEITPVTTEQTLQPTRSTQVADTPAISIELPYRHGPIRLDWPIAHAAGLAACLRQLLQ